MILIQNVYKDVEDKMKRAVGTVSRELTEIRGGRAAPALLEHVTVGYYGVATPLKQVAAITSPEPHMLVVQPWDPKVISEIEKAIQKSGLGITPMVEGKLVRLPIPSLTGDRREQLAKL